MGYDRDEGGFSHGSKRGDESSGEEPGKLSIPYPDIHDGCSEGALECEDSVQEFNCEYRKRRELMTEGLSSIPGIRVPEPEGAFYVFADVTGTGMTDIEFADGALEAGVQLIPASQI